MDLFGIYTGGVGTGESVGLDVLSEKRSRIKQCRMSAMLNF